jgi:hypothetical protein
VCVYVCARAHKHASIHDTDLQVLADDLTKFIIKGLPSRKNMLLGV